MKWKEREKMINVKRSNCMLVMLYNEWKTHENIDRPLEIEWNIMHMFSSSQIAKLYAIKHDLDVELCSLIAILHDIAVVEARVRENHDKIAEDFVIKATERYNTVARKNLPEITDEELSIIVEAVTVHSDKDVYSDNKYVEMLKDVDSLDRYLYGIQSDGAYSERILSFMDDLSLDGE